MINLTDISDLNDAKKMEKKCKVVMTNKDAKEEFQAFKKDNYNDFMIGKYPEYVAKMQ